MALDVSVGPKVARRKTCIYICAILLYTRAVLV